ATQAALRQVVAALSAALRPQAIQQALRAPPGGLLRPEPSRRGLRRDLRRLARAKLALAAALQRLACAAEARVRRRGHARARRTASADQQATGGRSPAHHPEDAARGLPRGTLPRRARQPTR